MKSEAIRLSREEAILSLTTAGGGETAWDGASSSEADQHTLWDAFWARHAGQGTLFDTLLWAVRSILSRQHAAQLLERCRETRAPMNPVFRVLEIGCGSAETSAAIARRSRGARNFVVDLSGQAIKLARTRNPRFHCVVADALSLPFASGQFSLSFSSGVIEHFERPIAAKMVREHCRVAKPRGAVGVIVPWRSSPYNLLRILCGRFWLFGREIPFSKGELRRFLAGQMAGDVEIVVGFGTTLLAVGNKNGMPSFSEAAE